MGCSPWGSQESDIAEQTTAPTVSQTLQGWGAGGGNKAGVEEGWTAETGVTGAPMVQWMSLQGQTSANQ